MFVTGGAVKPSLGFLSTILGGEPTKSMFWYDIEEDRWEQGMEMNQFRVEHSSCVLGDKLYIFGGWTDMSN